MGPARHLLWGIVLAEAIGGASAAGAWWLGWPGPRPVGDLLFAEGALLLVTSGLAELSGSVTAAQIGALHRSRVGDPPRSPRTPRYRYRILVAGLLLCAQGALLAWL